MPDLWALFAVVFRIMVESIVQSLRGVQGGVLDIMVLILTIEIKSIF
jgi:hypothetical protein